MEKIKKIVFLLIFCSKYFPEKVKKFLGNPVPE
jgi:hypothetical protein